MSHLNCDVSKGQSNRYGDFFILYMNKVFHFCNWYRAQNDVDLTKVRARILQGHKYKQQQQMEETTVKLI